MRGLWARRLKGAGLDHVSGIYTRNRDLFGEMAQSLKEAETGFDETGTLPPASDIGLQQVLPIAVTPPEKPSQ